ncbi:MAG: hypothetical protein LBM06_07320 [Prevotellaceae bacterium]|nr:hypothetical protein [Prevotellaceae bacterium]
MKQKSPYQAPSIDLLKMEGEGVIAASTQDFGAGKRYDLGQDTPQSLTRGLFRFAKNLLPLVAALWLLPACSSDDEPQVAPVGGKITLTVTAGTADTRTLYTDPDDETMTVTWNNNSENIGVVRYQGTTPMAGNEMTLKPFVLTGTGTGTKAMTFTGSLIASTGTLANHYNYYYPVDPDGWVDEPTAPRTFVNRSSNSSYFGTNEFPQSVANPTAHLVNYEVMYTPAAVLTQTGSTTSTAGSNIVFKHANALLRFDLTLPEALTVKALVLYAADGSTPFSENTVLTFNDEATGSVTVSTDGTSGQLYLPIDAYTPSTTLKAYMMVSPVADLAGKKLRIVASTADGTHYQSAEFTTGNQLTGAADDDCLGGGLVYTFAKTLTKADAPLFAGSNIYWNEATGKLTFDDAGNTAHAAAQGIFFKHFSLIGISPASEQSATALTTYTPTYNASNPSGSTWAPGTQDYGFITNIEAYLPDDFFNNQMDLKTPAEIDALYAQVQGDICRYLSATGAAPGSPAVQWRMPTRNELNPAWFDLKQVWTKNGGSFSRQTLTDTTGLATIASGYTFKEGDTFFPASGRYGSNGALDNVGMQGDYAGSNTSVMGGTSFQFTAYSANLDGYADNVARPVRCVKVQ